MSAYGPHGGGMPAPLAEPGPELGRRNRRILAERLGWPDGAVDACEDLEQRHPGWLVSWCSEVRVKSTPGFDAPAGFYARPAGAEPGAVRYIPGGGQVYVRGRELYATTAAELEKRLAEEPPLSDSE